VREEQRSTHDGEAEVSTVAAAEHTTEPEPRTEPEPTTTDPTTTADGPADPDPLGADPDTDARVDAGSDRSAVGSHDLLLSSDTAQDAEDREHIASST
jgi:hypothetical protein